MKFLLHRTSDAYGARTKEVEINSLEELMALRRREGWPIVIDAAPDDGEPGTLEIYDDYRE